MRLLALAAALLAPQGQDGKEIRVGIVGLDTSHVVAFTKLLNDPKDPNHVPGAKVVCAWKGGSPDIPSSADRVEGFTRELSQKWGVEIVGSIEALCSKVDAVLLESVDGRPHLEQARPVFAAKKRVFIDKPLAGSWRDGREIARLSKESGTPFFSASSYRFHDAVGQMKNSPLGAILGCDARSPASLEPHHPDLFWYGVHGVEILYAIMGPGCESLRNWHSADVDMVTARWKDGRMGTLRGIRKGSSAAGATVYYEKGISSTAPLGGSVYRNLVREIVKFFQTGTPPVAPEELVEVLAFMQAAQLSKERGGAEVRLDELK